MNRPEAVESTPFFVDFVVSTAVNVLIGLGVARAFERRSGAAVVWSPELSLPRTAGFALLPLRP